MAIRAISGLVLISRNAPRGVMTSNSVTIDLLTNTLVGPAPGGIGLADTEEIGPPGVFTDVPVKNVSIRQFETWDQVSLLHQVLTGGGHRRYRIDDDVTTTTATITWEAVGSATFIEEISYLFIGEVQDAPDVQGGNGNGDDDDDLIPEPFEPPVLPGAGTGGRKTSEE